MISGSVIALNGNVARLPVATTRKKTVSIAATMVARSEVESPPATAIIPITAAPAIRMMEFMTCHMRNSNDGPNVTLPPLAFQRLYDFFANLNCAYCINACATR